MKIEKNGNYLRLRWTHQGERLTLGLRLKDSKSNRIKAQRIALQIEADIEEGIFDPSLAKYRPDTCTNKPISDLTPAEIFLKWLEYKSKLVDKRTLDWYKPALKPLAHFGNISASSITPGLVTSFVAWMKPQAGAETQRRKLEAYQAAWDWAVQQGFLDRNPWLGAAKLIKPPAQSPPDPFTKEEVELILKGFKSLYQSLYHFVHFLFNTGCRLGEARALRWIDLSPDCRRCTINGQLARTGKRKAPKNRRGRVIILPDSLAAVLHLVRQTSSETEYVFLWKEKPIDESAFYKRWKTVLERQCVRFRNPYNTRATFISHALERGTAPGAIAQQTGHSLKVLFSHYAGYIESSPKLPELF